MFDWIPAEQLERLTNVRLKTQYNQHSSGTGALAPILTKLGGRLGCWRSDYDVWRDAQLKLKPSKGVQRTVAIDRARMR